MSKSADCRCKERFTCGHCLRNAKPYVWNGQASLPAAFSQPGQDRRERARAYHAGEVCPDCESHGTPCGTCGGVRLPGAHCTTVGSL